MATTYYLTTTASDLSAGGDNWDNTLEEIAPGTTTLSSPIPKSKSEQDYAFTEANNPSTDGISGDFTVTVEVNTGISTTTLDIGLARVNSAGTVQSGPVTSDGGAQGASAGTLTFNLTAPALGTWSSGDRLRTTFYWVNTIKTAATIIQDIGSAGTNVLAPWDIGGDVNNAIFFGCNF